MEWRKDGAGHQFLAGFIHQVWWHPPDDGRQHGGGGGAGWSKQHQADSLVVVGQSESLVYLIVNFVVFFFCVFRDGVSA